MADETSGPGPAAPVTPDPAGPNKDARTMGMLAHILGIPLGFLGPLIIWLIKKDEMPFVDDQGKESLNFQITVLIAFVVSGLLTCVFIGMFLFPVVFVGNIILCIMGAMKANNGETYRYPFALRLIK